MSARGTVAIDFHGHVYQQHSKRQSGTYKRYCMLELSTDCATTAGGTVAQSQHWHSGVLEVRFGLLLTSMSTEQCLVAVWYGQQYLGLM